MVIHELETRVRNFLELTLVTRIEHNTWVLSSEYRIQILQASLIPLHCHGAHFLTAASYAPRSRSVGI